MLKAGGMTVSVSEPKDLILILNSNSNLNNFSITKCRLSLVQVIASIVHAAIHIFDIIL